MNPTCACTAYRSASPLGAFTWYQRLHAWALSQGNARYDAAIGATKQALFGRLAGTVLEIGPGSGANLPYFGRDVRWIGIEPNPHARRRLADRAAAVGLQAQVLDGVAERIPLPDASVDAVACSLVLCTVADPAAALQEVRRVLKPGGRFAFIEHVAAPQGSWLRRAQRVMRGPQALLGDGCRPDRDTRAALDAAGFAWVVTCDDRLPVPLVSPHLIGFAVR